ncbi:MAG: glycosyltransferase family 39 protein [Phycisphaerae bacterium]
MIVWLVKHFFRWADRLTMPLVVALLVWLALPIVQAKLEIVTQVQFVGHADEAAYAHMGRSLHEGKGFMVPYVSWHFIPYDANITRLEDHWPPLMGLMIWPCFALWGVEPWVAKIPAILMGTIGLPVISALLAHALSKRAYVGLVAGIFILMDPHLLTESLKTLSDITTAVMLAGFAWALLNAVKYPRWHLLAGVFLACACLAKGSALAFLGLYPLLVFVAGGWRAFWCRWLVWGGVTCCLLMAPWWYANWRAYGHPLHSTQRYVSGYIAMLNWDAGTYYPYWGQNLPKLSDRWERFGNGTFYPYLGDKAPKLDPKTGKPLRFAYDDLLIRNREQVLRVGLLGTQSQPSSWCDFGEYGAATLSWLVQQPVSAKVKKREANEPAWGNPRYVWNWTNPLWQIPAVGVVIWLAGWGLLRPIAWLGGGTVCFWRRWHGRPRKHAWIGNWWLRWIEGGEPGLALLLIALVHGGFIVLCWEALPRLAFALLPFTLALGLTGWARLLEAPWWILFPRTAQRIGLIISLVAVVWIGWIHLRQPRAVIMVDQKNLVANTRPRAEVNGQSLTIVNLMQDSTAWLITQGDGIIYPTTTPAEKTPLQLAQTMFPDPFTHPFTDKDRKRFPWTDANNFNPQITAGRWIKTNLPADAVVLTRYPWQILFYAQSSQKGVTIAYARPETIFAIAKYYRCTHFIVDIERPGLREYVAANPTGLERLPDAPVEMYQIHWDKLPNVGILPPDLKLEPAQY